MRRCISFVSERAKLDASKHEVRKGNARTARSQFRKDSRSHRTEETRITCIDVTRMDTPLWPSLPSGAAEAKSEAGLSEAEAEAEAEAAVETEAVVEAVAVAVAVAVAGIVGSEPDRFLAKTGVEGFSMACWNIESTNCWTSMPPGNGIACDDVPAAPWS